MSDYDPEDWESDEESTFDMAGLVCGVVLIALIIGFYYLLKGL